MEILRGGKMPLNANDQVQAYRSKKLNIGANMHINKNHNIFEDGYHAITSSPDDLGPLALDYVKASNPNGVDPNGYAIEPMPLGGKSPIKKSPSKRFSKLGAMYNPNNLDPRRV